MLSKARVIRTSQNWRDYKPIPKTTARYLKGLVFPSPLTIGTPLMRNSPSAYVACKTYGLTLNACGDLTSEDIPTWSTAQWSPNISLQNQTYLKLYWCKFSFSASCFKKYATFALFGYLTEYGGTNCKENTKIVTPEERYFSLAHVREMNLDISCNPVHQYCILSHVPHLTPNLVGRDIIRN